MRTCAVVLTGENQVESISILFAIIALVFLPCIRVWRSTGYDANPGMLVVLCTCLGIVAYELTTRYYFVPLFNEQYNLVGQGSRIWIPRSVGLRHCCEVQWLTLCLRYCEEQGL